jgi:4-amino-4-deoxy-L-arabinose transferase-like glycosyltransferase
VQTEAFKFANSNFTASIMSALNSAAHLSDRSGSVQTRSEPSKLRSIVREWKRISQSTLRLTAWKETTAHLLLLAPLLLVYAVVALFAPHTTGSDEVAYLKLAENLSHGFYSGRGPDINLWYPPGLPLLLTPFVAMSAPIELMRLLGAAWLFVAVVLFYLLLRLTVSPRVALVGAIALGLYWPMFTLLPVLTSEPPALAFLVGFMFAFTLDLRRPRHLTLFAASSSLAALALTRAVFGWVLLATLGLALAMFLVRRSGACKRLAVATAIALALTSPWLLYTYEVTGKPFYWASSGGLSLYWMSSPYPGDLGDWHSPEEVRSEKDLAPHRPFFDRLEGLNQVESDEQLKAEALRLIRQHPLVFVENVAANTSRLWFGTPYSYTPQKLSTTFYTLPNAFLLVGLVVSAAIIARSRRRLPESVPFILFLAGGLGIMVPLFALPRYLIPLVPLVLWLIVQAAAELPGVAFQPNLGQASSEAARRPGTPQFGSR